MKIGSFILVAIGAFMAGAYYYENKNKINKPDEKPSEKLPEKDYYLSDEMVDTELDDSFPASDPPSWTRGELP
jgi:hypothetical protein